ncbi:diguanylate cyclase (GGDEF) domain-containing protein [Enterobacter sp. CC120223-11]|nr:diguanylate cyclase (GGDEF) domain-containing protein [Enterobacter sp. CC120223-11]
MNGFDQQKTNDKVPGLRFVRRMYLMRILGTFLCFFPILSVLDELDRPLWLRALLAINAFVWPTVAWLRARNARAPLVAEHQNLVIDAGAGGFWIAIIALNPLPSVVIATILLADRLAAGGVVLMRKAVAAMLCTFAIAWLCTGMEIRTGVSQRTMFATLPLIAIYLLALCVLTDILAVKLRRKSHELERIAMKDPLLDIANRRLLEKHIAWELSRLQNACGDSALVFIDLDNFKDVNDRYGHKVGDAMLETVSQILHVATRSTDTPARLGGDEFVILLPDTSRDEAVMIAHRIMEATAVITALPDSELSPTLSIGVACARPDMEDVAAWLKAADDALYEAKRRGKNQIFAH